MNTIENFIVYLAIASSLFPVMSQLIFASKKKINFPLKLIFGLTFFSFATDLTNEVLYALHLSNRNVINVFSYIEFIIFFLFFNYVNFQFRYKKLLTAFILAYTVIYFFIFFHFSKTDTLYSPIFESTIIILLSIIFFFKMMNFVLEPSLTGYYLFWINTAILIYFTGSFFTFLMEEYILNVSELSRYWVIHDCLSIIANIFLSLGVIQWNRNKTWS
jgi:hypothetical protein